jgi:ABC-2 type transport system ATP-binding protein
VLLAQALIHDPDVILMDEPVANLDPTARAEFYETLLKLKKQGKALFLSSHVLAELDKYFDSITILDGGKVIYTGKRDTIIKEFMNDQYTLKFSAQQKLIKYLNDKKIKFTEDSNKGLVASFKKTTDITDLISKLAAQHVYPEYISKSTPDLDRIYASKIIKGSVDQIEQKENKN